MTANPASRPDRAPRPRARGSRPWACSPRPGCVLAEAAATADPGERFRLAHLSALRTAAAVSAQRGRPASARRRLMSVWVLLERVAPEHADWAAYFAAGAPIRAAVEAGALSAVSDRSGRRPAARGHRVPGPGRGLARAARGLTRPDPAAAARPNRPHRGLRVAGRSARSCRRRALGSPACRSTSVASVRAPGDSRLVSSLLDRRARHGLGPPAARAALLDCGGGSGTFAVPLAAAGADVTVVDISADALATLQRRADEAGVAALGAPGAGRRRGPGRAGPGRPLRPRAGPRHPRGGRRRRRRVRRHRRRPCVPAACSASSSAIRPPSVVARAARRRAGAGPARTAQPRRRQRPDRSRHRGQRLCERPGLVRRGPARHRRVLRPRPRRGPRRPRRPRRARPASTPRRPAARRSPRSPAGSTCSPAGRLARCEPTGHGTQRRPARAPPGSSTATTRGCPMLHVDMDAFFASVEIKKRPELRGRPVVVGGGQRGVVAAASYEARRYGVRSAMSMSQALRLCPRAVVLPPDRAAYSAASAQVMAILRDVTPLVEPLSLDEAFLDVAGAIRARGPPGRDRGRHPRPRRRAARADLLGRGRAHQVRGQARLGPVQARRHAGRPGRRASLDFLHPLPVTALWGVGARTAEPLHRLGIRTVGDLAETPLDTLRRAVGVAAAEHLSAPGRRHRPAAGPARRGREVDQRRPHPRHRPHRRGRGPARAAAAGRGGRQPGARARVRRPARSASRSASPTSAPSPGSARCRRWTAGHGPDLRHRRRALPRPGPRPAAHPAGRRQVREPARRRTTSPSN